MSKRNERADWTDDDADTFAERLKRFHDEGLLWLVNTAIIARSKEDGTPWALGLLGDGSEPWVFVPGEDGAPDGSIYDRYERGEWDRYRRWEVPGDALPGLGDDAA